MLLLHVFIFILFLLLLSLSHSPPLSYPLSPPCPQPSSFSSTTSSSSFSICFFLFFPLFFAFVERFNRSFFCWCSCRCDDASFSLHSFRCLSLGGATFDMKDSAIRIVIKAPPDNDHRNSDAIAKQTTQQNHRTWTIIGDVFPLIISSAEVPVPEIRRTFFTYHGVGYSIENWVSSGDSAWFQFVKQSGGYGLI